MDKNKSVGLTAASATRPFAYFEWMLAMRYLRSRRRETFISVISLISLVGITLGVATLIIVMAVMNGFRNELLNKILGTSGHILIQSSQDNLTDYDQKAEMLEGLEPVEIAIPFIEGQALVSGPRGAYGVLVRGITRSDFARMPLLPGAVVAGSLDRFDAGEGIIIGSRLASQLGIGVGQSATLVIPQGAISPMGPVPRVKAYPVSAIFHVGMSEFDSTLLILPFAEAQLFFNHEGRASGIDLFTVDPDDITLSRSQVASTLDDTFSITDWRERNIVFFSALEVERNVMFIILTLIILIGALNIVSGLTMLVQEKGADIAILRTMGTSRAAILRIFIITGSSIGIMGTLLGVGLGLLVCENIESIRQGLAHFTSTEIFSPELYYLSRLPADVNEIETVVIAIMALLLALLATFYPAWRAARLDPVEVLRYE